MCLVEMKSASQKTVNVDRDVTVLGKALMSEVFIQYITIKEARLQHERS